MNARINRRSFLQASVAAGLVTLASPRLHSAEEKAPAPSSLIKGKDDRLIVLAKSPTVLETPLSLLDGQRITPIDRLFVRNNQQLEGSATVEPLPLDGWQIDLTGLIDKKRALDTKELAKLPTVEREMVLQCSGNARSLFAKAAKVPGTPWGRGGFGNVRFGGVPLSAVLDKHGVKIDRTARFVAAEGKDGPAAPGKPDFEHSLPLDVVLDRSILAFQLNGKPLPAVHGGPVRLVTPGFYGTMHVKWLSRLRFEKEESTNHFQIPQYRTPKERIKPGADFKFTFENSKPSYDMKVTSYILSPAESAVLPADQAVVVRGVAFNDGAAKIDRVEVSCTNGRTWNRATLEQPGSPFGWYTWSYRTIFGPGSFEIWSRATDARGRTQPLDGTIDWNPHGYEWNGVDRVAITAR